VLLSLPHSRAAAQPLCTGDCNGNRAVTVNEVLTLLNMALGSTATCAVNAEESGDVTIDKILTAVNNALYGCPNSRDWSAFVAQAKDAQCAESRNDLYVIDEALVFWVKEGNCPDASYGYVLYSYTPDDVVCAQYDSIAGPNEFCNDSSYRQFFDAIVEGRDLQDLGLGSDYAVRRPSLTPPPPTPTPTPCDSGPGIQGGVVAGAIIACQSEDGSVTGTTTSSDTGVYRLSLPVGRYRCQVSHPGYGTYSTDPGFVVVTGSCFSTANFFLFPLTPTTPTPMPTPVSPSTLERSICLGSCPAYTVSVDASGLVQYDGTRCVAVYGHQESSLSQQRLGDLVAAFQDVDFFALQDVYRSDDGSGCAPGFFDGTVVAITLRMSGMAKTVKDWHGCNPQEVATKLDVFERRVDEILGTAQWVPCGTGAQEYPDYSRCHGNPGCQ